MNVAEYLRKFLSEQPTQEAAIPGLGVFYIGLQDGRNRILFKEVPPVDKAFLNYYTFEENLGEEEAKAEIEKWVRKILSDLKGNGNVWIENIGAFDITSGKVVFTPISDEALAQTEHFGLETPAPSAPVAPVPESAPVPTHEPTPVPTPAPTPVAEPKPVAPNAERPRYGNQRKPLNPPVKRPQPSAQPTSSGKEILLGDRKKSAPRPMAVRKNPFYTQWWLLLICIVVVLAVLVFAIKPVREKVCGVFRPHTAEMRLENEQEKALQALADDLDLLLEDESLSEQPAEVQSEQSRQRAEENEEIARQVKAGQEQKKRQEAQVKNARQPQAVAKTTEKPAAKAQPKAEPKPVAKPAAKPASKPASKPAAKASSDAQKPVAGKFYIIVGSFSVEKNADNKCKEMCSNGYGAAKLYIEAKNLYYVSVKTCTNREEALKERAAFRDKGVDCWIFAN